MPKRIFTSKVTAIAALSLLTGTATLFPAWSTQAAQTRPRHTTHASFSLPDSPLSTPLQHAFELALDEPSVAHATVSAYAYDLTTQRPLADIHGNWQLIPASVMKLFTSAAALSTLGTQFHYKTTVRIPVSDSGHSSVGSIYLVGGGDPWLEADGALDLERMAKQLATHIKSATNVVGVSSLYSGSYSGTGWTWDDLPYNYAPNIAALTAERDQLNLWVAAGAVGSPPTVTTNPLNPSIDPTAPYLHIVNRARTTLSGENTLAVNRVAGTNTVIITGNLPAGQHANLFFSLHNPALLAASLLEQLLEKDGVHMAASATTGNLPTMTVPILVHESPALSTYLQIQNTYSINLMAENLFRMLGTVSGGNGTREAAQAFLANWEQTAGVTPPGEQVDGSGLSPLDEVSARQVVGLLRYAHTQPWFKTFEHSLIHIGQTNQCSFMCGLMDQTAADGTVWIKTGNLGNQWNYAGYAHAQNGNLIAFAVLLDGLSTNSFYQQAVGVQDQMTVDAASWPNEPTAPPSAMKSQSKSAPPPFPIGSSQLPVPQTSGAVLTGEMIDLRSGKVVWSTHAGLRLQPALLPRLALLSTLFQDHTNTVGKLTLSASQSAQHGTLHGSLTLSGDAVDVTEQQLAALAEAVIRAGITRVTGPLQYVSADPSAPANDLPASLPWEDFGRSFAPAVQDLAQNDGVLALDFTPTSMGQPASLDDSATLGNVTVVNDTDTTSAGTPASLVAQWIRGTDTYVVSGTVPLPASGSAANVYTVSVAAPHPGQAVASALVSALRQAGVSLTGGIVAVHTHASGQVLSTLSPMSSSAIALQELTDPSDALSFAIWHTLGSSGQAQFDRLTGGDDSIVDPSGLGLENYLTANQVATWLYQIATQPAQRPLYAALQTQGLWISTAPEAYALAGYVHVGGQEEALVVMENGLPWTGHFAPSVSFAKAP